MRVLCGCYNQLAGRNNKGGEWWDNGTVVFSELLCLDSKL